MKFGLSTLSEAGSTHVLVSGALELTSGDLSVINVFLFLHSSHIYWISILCWALL